jgi:hypothetical protein
LERENRWSDLLAVLIERDFKSAPSALGLADRTWSRLQREYGVTAKDRVDLILESDGTVDTVVEVKLLSGLGVSQLDRYRRAFPQAQDHLLISPGRLRVDIARETGWKSVTWESVLDAFATSPDPWVADTAKDWHTHLDQSLPAVGPDSLWNDLSDGEDFVLAMRARSSWVFDNLALPGGVDADLIQSSSGVSWVVRVFEKTSHPSYWILAEAEETLANQCWPKSVAPNGTRPLGPSILVTLLQSNVSDSRSYDWAHLHKLWSLMSTHRTDWATTSARPKAAHDKEAIARLRAAGAPSLLGAGYGDAQARMRGACMFGARFRVPAGSSLRDVSGELERTAELVHELAQVPLR